MRKKLLFCSALLLSASLAGCGYNEDNIREMIPLLPDSCSADLDCKIGNQVLGQCIANRCHRFCNENNSAEECEEGTICESGLCRVIESCPIPTFGEGTESDSAAEKFKKSQSCVKIFEHTPSLSWAQMLYQDVPSSMMAKAKDDFTSDHVEFTMLQEGLGQGMNYSLVLVSILTFLKEELIMIENLAQCLKPQLVNSDTEGNYNYIDMMPKDVSLSTWGNYVAKYKVDAFETDPTKDDFGQFLALCQNLENPFDMEAFLSRFGLSLSADGKSVKYDGTKDKAKTSQGGGPAGNLILCKGLESPDAQVECALNSAFTTYRTMLVGSSGRVSQPAKDKCLTVNRDLQLIYNLSAVVSQMSLVTDYTNLQARALAFSEALQAIIKNSQERQFNVSAINDKQEPVLLEFPPIKACTLETFSNNIQYMITLVQQADANYMKLPIGTIINENLKMNTNAIKTCSYQLCLDSGLITRDDTVEDAFHKCYSSLVTLDDSGNVSYNEEDSNWETLRKALQKESYETLHYVGKIAQNACLAQVGVISQNQLIRVLLDNTSFNFEKCLKHPLLTQYMLAENDITKNLKSIDAIINLLMAVSVDHQYDSGITFNDLSSPAGLFTLLNMPSFTWLSENYNQPIMVKLTDNTYTGNDIIFQTIMNAPAAGFQTYQASASDPVSTPLVKEIPTIFGYLNNNSNSEKEEVYTKYPYVANSNTLTFYSPANSNRSNKIKFYYHPTLENITGKPTDALLCGGLVMDVKKAVGYVVLTDEDLKKAGKRLIQK